MADQNISIPDNVKQEIPYGYCHCGCGQKTKISKQNRKDRNWIKGKHKRFLPGHNSINLPAFKHNSWKGGRVVRRGYVQIHDREHNRTTKLGYVLEHIVIVENIIGFSLPPKSVIHHVNENKCDNRNQNLVVCQDTEYHSLLHRRQRAYNECGHAKWRKCNICKKYDHPDNLFINGRNSYHRSCSADKAKVRRSKIKTSTNSRQ